MSDAALVNLVVTATEAKAQALAEAGVAGTGTSSAAVRVACPDGPVPDPFGGPPLGLGFAGGPRRPPGRRGGHHDLVGRGARNDGVV